MKGWFAIPGVQDGDRTIETQMRGLGPALSEARGKSLLDLGCAEGCIAFEFLKAGAAPIMALDYNEALLKTAALERRKLPKRHRFAIEFRLQDLATFKPGRQWDIVLALAIVHKLDDPAAAVRLVADSAKSLAVIRMPWHAKGTTVVGKHSGVECDVAKIMRAKRFRLEREEQGPPDELVHYWRRK